MANIIELRAEAEMAREIGGRRGLAAPAPGEMQQITRRFEASIGWSSCRDVERAWRRD
jgi:hypothetical protein